MSEKRIGEDFIDCTSAGTIFVSQDHQVTPVIPYLGWCHSYCRTSDYKGGRLPRMRCRDSSDSRFFPSLFCALPTKFCDIRSDQICGPWKYLYLELPRIRMIPCSLRAFVKIGMDFRRGLSTQQHGLLCS